MSKHLLTTLIFLMSLVVTKTAWADLENPLNFRESDGSPDTYPYQVKVSNGTLTDNGDGTITISTGGGSGSPGGGNTSIQFNTSDTFSGDNDLLWFQDSNTLVISGDAGQVGYALMISGDTGTNEAHISHDGSAFFESIRTEGDALIEGGDITLDPNGWRLTGSTGAMTLRNNTEAENVQVTLSNTFNSIIWGTTTGIGTWQQTIPVNQIDSSTDADYIADRGTATARNALVDFYTAGSPAFSLGMEGQSLHSGSSDFFTLKDESDNIMFDARDTGSEGDFRVTGNLIGDNLDLEDTAPYVIFNDSNGDNFIISFDGSAGGMINSTDNSGIITMDSSRQVIIGSANGTRVKVISDGVNVGEFVVPSVVISTDLGVLRANISNDGSAYFQSIQLETALTVPHGGTGATSLTDGGILLGSGTGAITPLGVAANGQIPIGDGATDPVLATISGTADEIEIGNGAGSITVGIIDPLAIGKGGTGAALADPGADRIVFWDESANAVTFLTAGTGLTITDTTITSSSSPNGPNATVQYNDGGALSGDQGMTWFKDSNTLVISRDANQVGDAIRISTDTGGIVARVSHDGSAWYSNIQGGHMTLDGSSLSRPFILTDGSSIALDASRGNFFTVTLTGQPRTLSNLTNCQGGQKVTVVVSQDTTGSRKMGFGTNFAFGTTVTTYDASTTAGLHDYIGVICRERAGGISYDIVSTAYGYR